MFTIQELQVMLKGLMDLDIKGQDAIYMANLQTKINDKKEKTQKQLEEKAQKAEEIKKMEAEKSKTKKIK